MQMSDYIGKTITISMFLTINLAPALSPEIYMFPQISVVRTPCNKSTVVSTNVLFFTHTIIRFLESILSRPTILILMRCIEVSGLSIY